MALSQARCGLRASQRAFVRALSTSVPRLAGTRFVDPWWRNFDKPTHGFRDSAGFVNRLPLRLESQEILVHGTVDPAKMWAEYDDEAFEPILVGDKAVVTVWFNKFLDTDCGGAYLETWYNTYVTRKGRVKQITLPYESPFSILGAAALPETQSFLQRVICSDAPGNPGAAMKAITGGREIFGFPKHPVPGSISFVQEGDKVIFGCSHENTEAISMTCILPDKDPNALTIPVEVMEGAPDSNIGSPRLGGTHKGHNGAHQSFYSCSVKCTQIVGAWNPETDSLKIGDNAHYLPLSRWGFQPLVKVHSPDFKICAHKPSGWISGEEAAAEVKIHEEKIASGVMAGAL